MEQRTIKIPATSSVYRRINYIALTVILGIVIANIWLSAIFSGKTILSQQSTMMARAMLEQAAVVAHQYVTSTSLTVLQELVDNIASSEHINDAVIYDHQGKIIAKSELYKGIQTLLESPENNNLVTPFVTEIKNPEDQIIGYVGINFLQHEVLVKSSEFQNNIWKQLQLMLVLAFLMGILASRAFAKLRYRKTKIVKR